MSGVAEEEHAGDVRKVAGLVCITRQMVEDIEAMKRAMAQPVSKDDWEAWLAEDDDEFTDAACGCPCHEVIRPGLVPCPRCEQESGSR